MAKFTTRYDKYGITINTIKKILVIRFSSLGDILLTTPIIRSLKDKYPEARIDFVIKKQFALVYKCNPSVNKIIYFEKENEKVLREELIKDNYDLVMDLQNNWRSRSLTKGVSKTINRFQKPTLKKLLLVWLKINLLKEKVSIVQRYANAADVQLDNKGLDLFLQKDIKPTLEENKKYIGLCPGAKHFTKRWLPEYFVQLGNDLTNYGYQIVLFGGSSEKELCKKIAGEISGSINLQSEDNLYEIAVNMKQCLLIVSNDSGLMHTAASVNVPIIAVFGSTVQEFGFSPYGVKNLILENNFISCRPCSHIGRSSCPKKHFKCIKEVTPQDVLQGIQKIL